MIKRFKYKFVLDCLFGAVKLTKNADFDKCGYTDLHIGGYKSDQHCVN